ncbi:MAG TPA: efflux RND transporter permease subunit [Flavobacteriales bacterium]|nr:efflux RND transporter permease subunit [Flavobacteriales bacterium]HQV38457.1 efflux RND transporter permease subunit [Flavobacteriales bacterium]HQW32037.1 efflux RND transporter permease subunit [Flavobacteriales bacterium]HQY02509.1 efflux RND transporter permease subunit [Flavobacteriales bacterium]HQY79706.1 efflux RND transporter permease subunit [Flavobacteriales bacterium]
MKDFFVRYKNPVAVMLTVVLMGGLFTYTRLQSSLFPEVTFPKVKVIADSGLQPAGKMMVSVTRPLEAAIKRVPSLQTVRSVTGRGSCEISAFLSWDTDIDLAKQQVIAATDQVRGALPPGTTLTVEKMDPSILPVMGYVIGGGNKSAIELNLIAEYTVRPYLAQVQGVSDVRTIGGRRKEYRITLRPEVMSALHIVPDTISAALARTNFLSSDGWLFTNHRMYLTVTDATVGSLDGLRQLVISNDGKRIVRLGDISEVSIAEEPAYTRVNANGSNAVLVAVVKQPNANLIDITDGVQQRVKELNSGLLPQGVKLAPYYVQADFVRDSIRSVQDSLWIGLLLAIVVAMIFLRSWRSSLVLLITIPVTLGLSLIVMHALGHTLNIMTLGALAAAIGLIIDDAIVVTEQLHRTHEEHPGRPTRELIGGSVRFLLPAMVASSLSTIVIFLPFVLLSGVAGAYFKVLTDTMIITLACSFLVTWIGLPVVYLLLASPVASTHRVDKPVQPSGGHWVRWFIRKPWLSFGFLALIGNLAFFAAQHLETGFLPEMDEGSIVLDYTSPPGTSLEETDRMLREAEKTFAAVPEIQGYSRRTGTQMGFFITEPNYGDYLIQLRKDRKRSTTEVIDDIRHRFEVSQPALRIDFGQVIGDMLGDLMSSVQPIEIKVFGNDQHQLQALAKKVARVVESVSGTADVFDGIVIAGPSVDIRTDDQALARRGLTPQGLNDQLTTQLQGTNVGQVYERELVTPVRMVYPHAATTSLSDLEQARVFLPGGALVSASQVAQIGVKPGEAEIEREDLQPMVPVTARLNGRDLGSVMKDIQAGIRKNIALPQGYHITYGGAFKEQQQSFHELLMILGATSMLVFIVLLFLFRDLRVALVMLAIALFGVCGCILALFLTGTPLNVGSYTGIIMIVGIIGENAIFTYLQYAHNRKEQGVDDSLTYAIGTRLRPKLMTALGAIAALSPIALGIGAGAQLHQPLAIAVIGGFILALPLLLIVLPSMLRLVHRGAAGQESSPTT